MEPYAMRRLEKILTLVVWLSALIFVLAAILPGRPFWLGPRKLLYLSLTLIVLKGFCSWKNGSRSRFLEISPFLVFFLFSSLSFSRFPEYTFGVDDAYYYSYVRSIWIDGDLDLSNEYQLSGLVDFQDERTRAARTPAGYSPNIFPVGLSLFWTPFFLLGHLLANIFGLPADGFSRVYTHIVGTGNLLYACAGLYLCFRFCAFFHSKWLSLCMTAAVLLTAPHLWLFFRSFMMISEPLSFSLIACFLFCVYIIRNESSGWKWLLTGILFGTMTMVRFHNAVLGIVPAVILFIRWRQSKMPGFQEFGWFVVGAFAGFIPQLITWRFLFGEWFVNMGGAFLPFWKSPFLLETLFSARKGLFPWSPASLLCVFGLPILLKKNREWAWALILVVIATIWINSAQADWWGATSLGSRRFIPLTSIFVVGLASLYSAAPKIARGFLVFALVALISLNFYFVSMSRSGQLQAEHADRFADVLQGPYSGFRTVVYPLQFPVQLAYNLRYGTPLYGPLNEFFIGEEVFYFQKRAGEKILSEESPLFGEGWEVSDGVRRTKGPVSVLFVPLFMKEKPRIVVELSLAPVDQSKNVWVDFYWNGNFLRSRKIPADGRMLDVPIRSREYRSAVNSLTMRIYHSRTEESSPALMLRRIYFRPPLNLAEMAGDEEP